MEAVKLIDVYQCGSDGCFMCDKCFTTLVELNAANELVSADICCPCNMMKKEEDRTPIELREIFVHAPGAVDCYEEKKKKLLVARLRPNIVKEERERLEAEHARLAALSLFERSVHDSREHIIENILNLKCPKCGMVFLDFDGCFALYCGNKDGCGCGFCAFCLKDCGRDAHQHVAICPHKGEHDGAGNGYHYDFATFDGVQRYRRLKITKEYLKTLETNICIAVVDSCRLDFEDLKIGELVQEFGNPIPNGMPMNDHMLADELMALQMEMEEEEDYS